MKIISHGGGEILVNSLLLSCLGKTSERKGRKEGIMTIFGIRCYHSNIISFYGGPG